MIGAIALGQSSNESGCRALSLCAIRLASGSMVTLPAHAEPNPVDPRLGILVRVSNLVSFQPSINIFPVIQAATPNPNARNFRSDLPIESPKRHPTIPRRLFPCQQGRLESRCLAHSRSSLRGTNSRGFPSSRGQIFGDPVAPWVFEPGPGFGLGCPGNAGRCPRATLSSCMRQYRPRTSDTSPRTAGWRVDTRSKHP